MNIDKFHVFFRRVSTAGQDLAMQESADVIYREKLLPEEIKIFDEDAVSANKRALNQRPEMQMLISLIKQNKVHTLYAFDRTRLFRDFYEGMEFIELCSKHHVQIIYTSQGNGNIQATDDIFLEGILSMFSGIEGKNIARRTAEVHRRYPARKYGYVKIKETKKYPKDPIKQEIIEEYFHSLRKIASIEEFGELLKEFHNKLGCQYERLVEMARDPFFTAYDLSQGENKLGHVEPYIDLNTFYQIQESISGILNSYMEEIENLKNLKAYTPICGICRKPMNYRIDKASSTGFYTCSGKKEMKKHKNLTIMAEDLTKIIDLVIDEVISTLDSKTLLNHSIMHFRDLKKGFEKDLKAIEHEESEIAEKIILNLTDYAKDWKDDPQYKKVTQLKDEKVNLLRELEEKEILLQENKEVVESVQNYLQNKSLVSPYLLYQMFIHKIYVFFNELDIEVSKFDYLGSLQTDFTFLGDEIA